MKYARNGQHLKFISPSPKKKITAKKQQKTYQNQTQTLQSKKKSTNKNEIQSTHTVKIFLKNSVLLYIYTSNPENKESLFFFYYHGESVCIALHI